MSERGCCPECAQHSLYAMCEDGCVKTLEPELFRIMTMSNEELLADPNAERDAQEVRDALVQTIADVCGALPLPPTSEGGGA